MVNQIKIISKAILIVIFSIILVNAQDEYNKENHRKIIHLDSLGIFSTEVFYNRGNELLVSDYSNKNVLNFDLDTINSQKDVTIIGNGKGNGPGENKGIVGISSYKNTVYIADRESAKVSKWINAEYQGEYDFGSRKIMPSYIAISEKLNSLFVISSVFEKDVSVYEFDIVNEGKLKHKIKIESEDEDYLFLKDCFLVTNDSLLVIAPMNDPFLYIYNGLTTELKKIRVSNLIDKNSMKKTKNFLGQKSLSAKYPLYFNSSIAINNGFIYQGLSETEYINFNKIVKYDLNGQKISERGVTIKPVKLFIYNDELYLSMRFPNHNLNKIYVFELF